MEAHTFVHAGAHQVLASPPRWQQACCRAIDLVLAATLLLILMPLLLVLAIGIRLDSPGPAFFRQRRIGHQRRSFTMFKFRTMSSGADAQPHRAYVSRLIAGDVIAGDDGASLYKLHADPRVTSFGRLLRRWSLDELPQLLNVLFGHMSLVGPRPALDYEVAQYADWHLERFSVKPGMTGLWQVVGRNERTFEEMVRLDIEFAQRRSLRLYLSILLKTPAVVLGRKGVA
jgi:lipopolysaccharide/colanic/teichoic acid biosynthesis glycosyltransferase